MRPQAESHAALRPPNKPLSPPTLSPVTSSLQKRMEAPELSEAVRLHQYKALLTGRRAIPATELMANSKSPAPPSNATSPSCATSSRHPVIPA